MAASRALPPALMQVQASLGGEVVRRRDEAAPRQGDGPVLGVRLHDVLLPGGRPLPMPGGRAAPSTSSYAVIVCRHRMPPVANAANVSDATTSSAACLCLCIITNGSCGKFGHFAHWSRWSWLRYHMCSTKLCILCTCSRGSPVARPAQLATRSGGDDGKCGGRAREGDRFKSGGTEHDEASRCVAHGPRKGRADGGPQVHRCSRAPGSISACRPETLFEDSFSEGIGFDGSSIRGFQADQRERHAADSRSRHGDHGPVHRRSDAEPGLRRRAAGLTRTPTPAIRAISPARRRLISSRPASPTPPTSAPRPSSSSSTTSGTAPRRTSSGRSSTATRRTGTPGATATAEPRPPHAAQGGLLPRRAERHAAGPAHARWC